MLPIAVASSEPYRQSAEAVLAVLGSDAERGLSGAEAERRQAAFGPNLIATAPPRSGWRRFLDQFASALVLMLIAAGAISAAIWLHERGTPLPYEALAISSIVLLNAAMGYVQEARAERAAAALRRLSAAHARVIRDGETLSIDAAALVPGDVILVAEGDTIPADGRLLQATALQTVEAALTGESVPTAKDVAALPDGAEPADRANMVWSGTHAVYGHGRAVVTAVGMQTLMGRIAGLIEKAPQDETPLQRELERVGRVLGAVVLAIAGAVIGTILLMEGVRDLPQVLNVLILGVALAVAAVPEGLPAVVTAVLSLGMQRMARNKAIVRRLAAVETLGSATVIASDKTGTLTRNEMTVRRVVTASGSVALTGTGYAPDGALEFPDAPAARPALAQEVERALIAAERANNAILHEGADGFVVHGDPTEGALIVAARKAGLSAPALDARFARLGEVPFSSERKLMSTLHSDAERPSHLILVTKGAPDVLLAHCTGELRGEAEVPLGEARRTAILAANDALAGEALRTLGVAYRALPAPDLADGAVTAEHERDLVFIGLIGMMDPPRLEARAAVAQAHAAGIRTLMMTGDHPSTATVIAREVGIPVDAGVVTGARIAALDEAGLDRVVAQASVYARVDPEHKLRIVAALRRTGETVAVTGDGVNDAPALKAADIGIAMGTTGTDVSKEAADMVLADDNFATIVRAVAEGRAIFANIRKFLRYLLSSNIGEVMTMVLGLLLAGRIGLSDAAEAAGGGVALPLLATQILWINLVTDGAPALALGIDPADGDVMTRPPRRRGEGVITGTMWAGIVFVGAVMAAGTLFVIDLSLPGGLVEGQGTLAYGQTMAFTTLVLFQLFNVFNARSDTASAFVRPFANRWLIAAVAGSLLLHALVLYLPALQQAFSTVPLTVRDWLLCAAVASSVIWTRELWKLGARVLWRRRGV
ncbi:Ca2+-transporting ATPase [Xanthobacter flavus]|uniref:Ca2+-transporting ATPase n=1 Tax=Xanthobacter flavus TaxID=281 RepID=A0A9W6CJF5_XANFL|nr:cation-translocating P-type ATPase [Xanthobacter flavus]MDR6333882.1 Ca2+-transporting ATPase [Xanthobacter flavus]GLI20364.1 haloacid dehalogenase [Xanthobacter flavus]